ncbi:MAG: PEP-CTERM sorting domain-containing protein, partial [Rubrivivax sp.]|nr:PEP-CTERM sorting domain-containing protein [Rubrivivax sp.]
DELSLGSFTNIDWDDTAAATLSGGGLAAPMVLGEAGIDTAFSFSNVEVTASPIVLTLKGVADGTGIPGQISPGTYSIAAVAAPIPEPETFAMMLAGLGAIGFMAARRHRQG